ncbi:MAG: CRISPR-associated protein Cas4 [Chloroflexota bacterium]
MLYLSLLLTLLALVLFWQAARRRKAAGLPAGRVIYSDTRAWGPVAEPLFDAGLGLVGKPDYLVESSGQIIPVEVKSSRVGAAPYDAHIYQLAAYCLLVERTLGKRPPYGILHYANRTLAIDYTPVLEAELLALLEEIHAQERRKELPRSHQQPARCSRCGFRSVCTQRLL